MSVVFEVIAGICIVIAVVALAVGARSRRRARALEQRVRELEPYSKIGDVDAFARRREEEARRALDAAETQAKQVIDTAENSAASLIESAHRNAAVLVETAQRGASIQLEKSQRDATELQASAYQAVASAGIERDQILGAARKSAREISDSADRILNGAAEREREIIGAAEARAQEIAGEALTAVREAKRAEETLRALKNVIDGYGDAYLVPPQDLLDQLGEAYSFEEAGSRLKEVRAKVRQMVKEGRAATCDYVEEVRRKTAVEFVTDAFNGKVATILADVKDDNYGTLAQKLKDAAALVNENGQAFRNARVAPDYLQTRLEELKWAVAAYELRERDREEQRLLKERIREEERAQREFEKALKEAEKEEDLLRKAMEKAQAQFDKATDVQKAKYEEQLKELAGRLQAAEEKGKRAMSMAQQTKSGHVYVISNVGSFGEDVFKIGLTRRLEPLDRIRELGDASVPFDFDVHALIPSNDAPALERSLHKQFVRRQVNKVNPRKEFFRVAIDDIRKVIESTGSNVSWTIAAEARQYRETLAVERAMKDDPSGEDKWVHAQMLAQDLVTKPTDRATD